MANWSELSFDVLEQVVKRLGHEIEEFLRFSVVCKSWRSCAINQKLPCSPWLMLANKENDVKRSEDDEEGIRGFYIISSNRVLNLRLPTQGRRCWGTPYGWLITMGLDLKINLFNPLSRAQISLPPQPTFQHQFDSHSWPRRFCRYFIRKIALASNLCSTSLSTLDQGTVAMAIYGARGYLAFASPRDKVWTYLDGPRQVEDIIFFSDHFYVFTFEGVLRVCELGTIQPSAIVIASLPDCCFMRNYSLYLIELSGELHLVERITTSCDYVEIYSDVDDGDCDDPVDISSDNDTITVDDGDNDVDSDGDRVDGGQDEDPNKEEEEHESYTYNFHYDTKGFRVFKLNSMRTWSKVDDLGDHALFIGNNTSFAISTFQYPDFKSNCIYFTDDMDETYQYGHCDMGVYDLGKDSVSPFDISNEPSKFSRPVFFMPNSSVLVHWLLSLLVGNFFATTEGVHQPHPPSSRSSEGI